MPLPKKCYSLSVKNTNDIASRTGNVSLSYTDCCSGAVYQLQLPAQQSLDNLILDTPSLNTPSLQESNLQEYDCATGKTSKPLPPNQTSSPCGTLQYWNGSFCAPLNTMPDVISTPAIPTQANIPTLPAPKPGNLNLGNVPRFAVYALIGYAAYRIFFK